MTYTNTDMSMLDNDENGDERLPEHTLPKVIEELIEKGKYENMQRRVLLVCGIHVQLYMYM